jgi:hypothetical protein
LRLKKMLVTSLASSLTVRLRKGCVARAQVLANGCGDAFSGGKPAAEFEPVSPTLSAGYSVGLVPALRQVAACTRHRGTR